MSTQYPPIAYSPEGELTLNRNLELRSGDTGYLDAFAARAQEIGERPGFEVTETDVGYRAQIDVGQIVASVTESPYFNPALDEFLDAIQPFLGHYGYTDTGDYLLSLDYWHQRGAGAVIFPSMQRWLNAAKLDEELARESIKAMALPFGGEEVRRAEKEFSYGTDGESAVAGPSGFSFGVASYREDFGIEFIQDAGERAVHTQGTVPWNWLNLSTIGNCACWGVSGDERMDVYMGDWDSSRLYTMQPHNVDSSIQSLSLVLGLGTLTHAAAEYGGQEDILEHATWEDEARP